MRSLRDALPISEMRVRWLLHRLGYRFRVHVRIPITAKYADHAKSGGHKKAQNAQKSSLSSPNEERVRVRSRKPPATQLSTINHQLLRRRFVRPDISGA